MTNIKNKNKFLKFSSIFLIGVFAVFLAFMPFFMNKKTDKVMADSIDTNAVFTSSNFPVFVSVFQDDPYTYRYEDFNFMIFTFSSSSLNIQVSYNDSYLSFDVDPITNQWENHTFYNYPSTYMYYGGMVDSGFDYASVVSVTIFSDSNFFGDVSYCGTFFQFNDSNGLSYRLVFKYYPTFSSFYYQTRTYYFTTSLTDNSFYNQGKNDGLVAGRAEGLSEGYQRGLSEGFSNGERYGYNEGLVAGADVSFLNLIGATIDAPVQAFNGLFDFNINLGGSSFNLKNFLIALLTIALIIAFVRLIMAK